MASAAPLKDIDEQFLQCRICMEQLKEPKMLPCLHHYCRDCLKKVFKEAKEIVCPTCREKHTLPEGGVDGLKTDFNTKNIIEFIQLQSSVKVDPLRTCIHCKKRLEASAFCFKCNNFLCQGCYEFHASSEMVKDHHPHIFSLSEAEARNLTIQKLSSLKEAPRCHIHPEELSKLCCMTCGKMPICIACTYGVHQGHTLREVKSLAETERKKLTDKVADLMHYNEKIQEKQEEIRRAKDNLDQAVCREREKLEEQLNAKEENVKREMRDIDVDLKKKQAELKEKLKEKTSTRRQELEEEMRKAREKYDRVCKEEREEADAEFKKLQEESDRAKQQLQEGLDETNNNIQELLASVKTQEEENPKKIKELSDHFSDIVKRFETVTTTASSILAAKHDWTDIQCIPDICRAIDLLTGEVRRDYPELEAFSGIAGTDSLERIDISEKEESIVDIGIPARWYISSIHSSKDRIIITGETATNVQSFITVIDREGKQLKQEVIHPLTNTEWKFRYGAFLSPNQIATVCTRDEVGIYNIEDGTYMFANMSKIVKNAGPAEWSMQCVAVDESNNNILVGSCSRGAVYVCNDQLENIRILELPNVIQYPRDLTVHRGNLLVCDDVKNTAYAVTMDEPRCKIVYKFTTPDAEGSGRSPCNVCTDKNGYIYILWSDIMEGCMIAQYDKEGGSLLTTRKVDKAYYAGSITIVNTEHGEKILLATPGTQQLITYGLAKKK